ncbi:hypothetical protein EV121DRAFT_297013 [Schizophyllum commune]
MPFRSPVRFFLLASLLQTSRSRTTPSMPCERSTTWGAVDHTRTTDDWSPARSSLACSSQAKNTPPMMLVQAFKRFSAPSRRPKNRILTPNAPRSARGPLADERGVWPGRGGAARSAVASLFLEQSIALYLQSPRQRSQPAVMPMQVSKSYRQRSQPCVASFVLRRPQRRSLLSLLASHLVASAHVSPPYHQICRRDIDVLAPSSSGPYNPPPPRNLLVPDLLPISLSKLPHTQNRR